MRVLYLGDTSMDTAASYLVGVMTHGGIEFDYCASGVDPSEQIDDGHYHLYVLSDFASKDLGDRNARIICDAVNRGAGLLMIGGWESYHGAGGDYDTSPISEILPVNIDSKDDRVNWYGPCIVRKRCDHPMIDGIEFEPAPVIGGFNRFSPKPDCEVVLEVERYLVHGNTRDVRSEPGDSTDRSSLTLELIEHAPLLVSGGHGAGRVTALATDAAPHWVGGFVDWGEDRVRVRTELVDIEVGDRYVSFFNGVLNWTSGVS